MVRSLLRGTPLGFLILVLGAPAPVAAAPLVETLEQQAPQVMEYLRDQGYQNVGVLKFLIKKGGRFSSTVGTLNAKFADRLETALLLADDVDRPVGIIKNASRAAADIDGADHTTAAGRAALFAHREYPLLWGDGQVGADAFVTGKVEPRPDKMQMDVTLQVYTRQGVVKEFPFTARLDASLLTEIGKSYRRLRTLGAPREDPDDEEIKTNIVEQKAGTALHPLLDPKSPVSLEIFYGPGKDPVAYEPLGKDAGEKEIGIGTPPPGAEVRLVLTKKDATDDVYGVVLRVNGENTLFREKDVGLRCHKWILDKGQRSVTVIGYSVRGKNKAVPFHIGTAEEAAGFNYGDQLGQISVEVFRGTIKRPANLPPDEEIASSRTRGSAIEGGVATALKVQPTDLKDAQERVRDAGKKRGSSRSARRGVIMPDKGPGVDFAIEEVSFFPEEKPMMSATVIYFKPSR
jgi:hypothetical protein